MNIITSRHSNRPNTPNSEARLQHVAVNYYCNVVILEKKCFIIERHACMHTYYTYLRNIGVIKLQCSRVYTNENLQKYSKDSTGSK